MNQEPIGAIHDFHDPDYARDWAERFDPTPARELLFATILTELGRLNPAPERILELGIGPGYLAERIMAQMPRIEYVGVDYSHAMLTLATQRLAQHRARLHLMQLDLLDEGWTERISKPVDAIVSTWALHDLGSEAAIASVYRGARRILGDGALLLNGDFVKPRGSPFDYEPGRIYPSSHLELLDQAGFEQVEILLSLEESVEEPTSANNYICLKGL